MLAGSEGRRLTARATTAPPRYDSADPRLAEFCPAHVVNLSRLDCVQIHAALLGITRSDDEALSRDDRIARAVRVVEVLAEHGADMELAGPASSGGAKPAELAAKLGTHRSSKHSTGQGLSRRTDRAKANVVIWSAAV